MPPPGSMKAPKGAKARRSFDAKTRRERRTRNGRGIPGDAAGSVLQPAAGYRVLRPVRIFATKKLLRFRSLSCFHASCRSFCVHPLRGERVEQRGVEPE